MLTIIIPAYNEEAMIPPAAAAVHAALQNCADAQPYEIVFVNDGSSDRTWQEICALSEKDPLVRGVSFSRNFGKEAAIYAGLAEAGTSENDACVVMDCDLQQPPEKIPEMVARWKEGFEVVEGIKSDRGKESVTHGLFAKFFYKMLSGGTGVDMSATSDFKLLDGRAVKTLLSMPEKKTFFRALTNWIGFRSTTVSYEVAPRLAGSTKWSTFALVRYALSNISSFSTFPMQIVTVLGVITFIATLILSIISLCQRLFGNGLSGFTTVILLQGFIGSITMVSLGIIGYYIAKIYEEIKARPKYIVAERTGKKA
ncbi:MAG: glycosyltransferase family 2 protein [Lachnospiraceae bacterium]|nr:glycosyltransferase family 2 protein [Lachnospiraceae bacterium]